MSDINEWDVTDANNNSAPPDGWPENTMNYSEVNDAGRAVQGSLKRFFTDINGSLAAAGAANAYTLTLNAGYSAYFDGMLFACSIPAANTTTSPTINVNAIGARTIVDADGNALTAGALSTGGVYLFHYDGTNVRVLTLAPPSNFADLTIEDTQPFLRLIESDTSDENIELVLVGGTMILRSMSDALGAQSNILRYDRSIGTVWIDATDGVGVGTLNLTGGGSVVISASGGTITLLDDLSTTGTIDGRDVATDGTKLDGIESGATADQTAAEIRALVEAATDSNVFTDADHTKLDSLPAGGSVLSQTVVNIGTWNMDTTDSVSVAHGLTLADIRSIAVTIIDDSGNFYYDFNFLSTTESAQNSVWATSTDIVITRATGGAFDNVTFDSTAGNRGYIVIQHV